MEYLFDSDNGKYDMVYVNKTLNIGTFLANRKTRYSFQTFFKLSEKYGDFPKVCMIWKVSFWWPLKKQFFEAVLLEEF